MESAARQFAFTFLCCCCTVKEGGRLEKSVRRVSAGVREDTLAPGGFRGEAGFVLLFFGLVLLSSPPYTFILSTHNLPFFSLSFLSLLASPKLCHCVLSDSFKRCCGVNL